ncbi:MAG: 4-deoxy-4-formamido-L-arabinose-phosphoundecaprenol deformylase, partial [Desulfobacca sp.]
MRLALKIDVDTLVGLQEGVPALLRVLAARGIRASFFVAMGPDHSGRAIRRLFTHKGFWQKMRRTGAPRLYGLKT